MKSWKMRNGQDICSMKELNHRIGYMSIFFSTVYNKIYYIISSLMIALLLEMITTVNININPTIIYWIAIIIYFISMYILYIICKKYRKKHNKLDIKKLNYKYIALRLFIMFIYTMFMTMLIPIIHVGIVFIILK